MLKVNGVPSSKKNLGKYGKQSNDNESDNHLSGSVVLGI